MSQIEKIVVLENLVEAQLLSGELSEREIPHYLRSYNDSAYDGLFQLSRGWGHIEAESIYKAEILEILDGIRTAEA